MPIWETIDDLVDNSRFLDEKASDTCGSLDCAAVVHEHLSTNKKLDSDKAKE